MSDDIHAHVMDVPTAILCIVNTNQKFNKLGRLGIKTDLQNYSLYLHVYDLKGRHACCNQQNTNWSLVQFRQILIPAMLAGTCWLRRL